ncbi:LysR family substrate-binding domain-containing protein, partial [Actinocorallia lasiicapitis]
WSPELGQALHAGRLDLVISHSVPHSDALDRAPLRHEPLVALVAADHALADRAAICLAELSGETFCFHERPLAPAYHDLVLSALPPGFRVWEHPVPGLRLNPLLPDGTGFTLLSASAAALMPTTLKALPLLDPLPTVPVELVWHPGALSPETRRLLDTARTLAAERSWI